MTRRTRFIVFSFSIVLFIIVAPLTVFYSLGWRIDWANRKVIQPGIFYFKVWPKSCQIYIDGKVVKKTDFFFGSALIENLLPKKYKVEIKKDGFQTWQKTLEIKARSATEAKNIVLMPERPNFITITRDVEKFFVSPDEKKMILEEKGSLNNETPQNQGWSLKLLDLEKNIKSHLIGEQDIPKKGAEFIDLKFSPDSKRLLIKTSVKETSSYYLLALDRIPISLDPLDLAPETKEVYFNPLDPQKLLVLKSGQITNIDITKNQNPKPSPTPLSPPLLENVVAFYIYNNSVYYFDSSGFLQKTSVSFNGKDKINTVALPPKPETEYKIIVQDPYIFLKEADIIYKFQEIQKSFEKISEPVKDLTFSPDSKKIAYFNDYEIWVLFLAEKNDQPQKAVGAKMFLTRFSEKIGQVFWLNDYYLVFNEGNKIKVAEVDDRDEINFFDLGEIKEANLFWSKLTKKLFFLSEGRLYSLEKLVP